MSVFDHPGDKGDMPVRNAESMIRTIYQCGIIPLFYNAAEGFSIEEKTPSSLWFSEDSLGPWDWKVDAVQTGEIAYGKFISGKAAFATEEWFAHLANYRRSRPENTPKGLHAEVLDFIRKNGSASVRDIRLRFSLKKSAVDSIVTRLQQGTWLVTGDIERVYRGADLHYDGWQRSSFCAPEDLFAAVDDIPFGPFKFAHRGFPADCSPEESFSRIVGHILSTFPAASESAVVKLIK